MRGQEYAAQLPECDFNSYEILSRYLREERVELQISRMPPEIDVAQEWSENLAIYHRYIIENSRLFSAA